jgi:multimeric flavodoxin WrbA
VRLLILNGADHADTALQRFVDREQAELERAGMDVTRFDLADERLAFCQGCFDCWVRTPGICSIDDGAREILEAYIKSDVVLMVTPIAFGGYGEHLKKALDRSIGLVSPFFTKIDGETHHKKRYDHYPAVVAVGSLREPDPEEAEIFRDLVARNAINSHTPAHAAEVVERGLEDDCHTLAIIRRMANEHGGAAWLTST